MTDSDLTPDPKPDPFADQALMAHLADQEYRALRKRRRIQAVVVVIVIMIIITLISL